MLPSALLRELGVEPSLEREFTLADGRKQRMGLGEIRFRIDPAEGDNGVDDVEERTSLVVFGPSERLLLGAVTLQTFGLIADTTHHKPGSRVGVDTIVRKWEALCSSPPAAEPFAEIM